MSDKFYPCNEREANILLNLDSADRACYTALRHAGAHVADAARKVLRPYRDDCALRRSWIAMDRWAGTRAAQDWQNEVRATEAYIAKFQ